MEEDQERIIETYTMFNGTMLVVLTNKGRLLRKEISYLDSWSDWEDFGALPPRKEADAS